MRRSSTVANSLEPPRFESPIEKFKMCGYFCGHLIYMHADGSQGENVTNGLDRAPNHARRLLLRPFVCGRANNVTTTRRRASHNHCWQMIETPGQSMVRFVQQILS